MGVYHIVLFKLKPGVEDEKVQELTKALYALVGKIPGENPDTTQRALN